MLTISDAFAQRILHMHGDAGRAWLARLPQIIANCAQRWDLVLGGPFGNLSYNFVMVASTRAGLPRVVKACTPTGEFAQEAEALRLFAGRGMAQLMADDPADEVLLLERLLPGKPLRDLPDVTQSTAIAAGVMRQLWRPVPPDHHFPTVAAWSVGLTRLRQHYDGGTGPFPAALVEKAEILYAELSASAAPAVLLHGDLHHENILAAQRAPWLAIDPKGLVGEPAYEVGAWLRNPKPYFLHRPNPHLILARQVDQLAEELGLDRTRILCWGLYQAVLSAWWDVEDHGQPSDTSLICAQMLAAI